MSNVWEIANEVENLNYKISSAMDVLELIATEAQPPSSGATWAVREMLDSITEKLQIQVDALLAVHKELTTIEEPKKAKKK